ncbi:MAG: hypothetical protein ACK4NC_05570 [Candidatus Gracilibacteria bacterium]
MKRFFVTVLMSGILSSCASASMTTVKLLDSQTLLVSVTEVDSAKIGLEVYNGTKGKIKIPEIVLQNRGTSADAHIGKVSVFVGNKMYGAPVTFKNGIASTIGEKDALSILPEEMVRLRIEVGFNSDQPMPSTFSAEIPANGIKVKDETGNDLNISGLPIKTQKFNLVRGKTDNPAN